MTAETKDQTTNQPEEFRVSCRVPKALRKRLQKIAKATGVSESDIVRMGLNKFLPEYEKQMEKAA